MKTLTMVMKCGTKDTPADQMSYTCIAEDYSIVRLTGAEITKAVKNSTYALTNMGVGPKGLVSTNGAFDKYTLVNAVSNQIEGKASPVVLNRVEAKDKLVGYTIFNTAGVLQEVSVEDAVRIHTVSPFSNGKIRHTQDGDIIASIAGNYTLRIIEITKAQAGEIKVDIVFIGSAIGSTRGVHKYAGIMINCDNAADLSKIYSALAFENKELIEAITKTGGGTKVSESLAVKRTGTAGIYGVFPIKAVLGVIKKAGNKAHNKIGSILVACVDYSADGVESRVKMSKDLKLSGKETGSERSDTVLKVYLGEIITALKEVKIEG